jgi:putative hydrolase of the HAD superfamily
LKTYRHIFFDLDSTLWDYDKNSIAALAEIIDIHGLIPTVINVENFWKYFSKNNDTVWELYNNGLINKDILRNRRFEMTLNDFGINNPELAQKLNEDFLKLSPKKTALIDGTIELLTYLKSKKYNLYIITNGFTHIQNIKMKDSKINVYFERIFTADIIKSSKPHRKIFEYAVKSSNAKKKDCLMIGDNLKLDILGAQNFGMDQVYFNPKNITHNEHPTYEIGALSELKSIL